MLVKSNFMSAYHFWRNMYHAAKAALVLSSPHSTIIARLGVSPKIFDRMVPNILVAALSLGGSLHEEAFRDIGAIETFMGRRY